MIPARIPKDSEVTSNARQLAQNNFVVLMLSISSDLVYNWFLISEERKILGMMKVFSA